MMDFLEQWPRVAEGNNVKLAHIVAIVRADKKSRHSKLIITEQITQPFKKYIINKDIYIP